MRNNIRRSGAKKLVGVATLALLLGVGSYMWMSGSGTPAAAETTAGDAKDAASDSSMDQPAAVNGWQAAEAEKEYVYCVGSVSKIYSTAAVLQLVDEGRVDLDGAVTEYIPDFKMADERYKNITVRMLMNHTSGLMGSSVKAELLYDDDDRYHQENLLKELAGQRLKADPGKYASYCNDGFDLLALITERVTGMDFTEYVKKHLATPTGGTQTGSGFTYKEFDNLAPAYSSNGNLYEQGVTTCIGAGGIYASAADVARFGAGFFKGNTAILSGNSKEAMATRWDNSDEYMDGCGLGWDDVEGYIFQDTGVRTLGKGGDSGMDHSYLMVAPENRVSISVQSNGGSSALNGMVAQVILQAVLEEKGIVISREAETKHEIAGEIPSSYDKYIGSYIVAEQDGETIDRISFPDHAYMHVEKIGPLKTDYSDYALCEDGRFYELAYEVSGGDRRDMRLAMNADAVSFVDGPEGKTYIANERTHMFPGIGSYKKKTYIGERLEENPVSEGDRSTWESLDGAAAVLSNDIYSSGGYDLAMTNITLPKEYPGYVYFISGMGTKLLKIADATHAMSFQTIPSSRNRDQIDIRIDKDDEGVRLSSSIGYDYRLVTEDIPELNEGVKEIKTATGKAAWYRIGDEMKNTELHISDRPADSAVYVYNKFGEVVYTTHITDMTDDLPMPEDGMVLFLGKDGGSIRLDDNR